MHHYPEISLHQDIQKQSQHEEESNNSSNPPSFSQQEHENYSDTDNSNVYMDPVAEE